jgi:hypothetical protein
MAQDFNFDSRTSERSRIPLSPESLMPEKRLLWEKLQARKERIHWHDHDPDGSQH